MCYITKYNSIIGTLVLTSDFKNLTGLFIEGFKDISNKTQKDDLEIFIKTKKWLDEYFLKKNPSIENLELKPKGTDFQKTVYSELLKIPYSKTASYKNIAYNISKNKNKPFKGYRAIGSAINKNPIIIIIPCHRVINENKNLGGYSMGLEIKKTLLKLEGCI